jgi:hypothetical protein
MISLTPMIIMSSYREFIEAEKSRKVERSVKKPNSEIARSASTFLIRGGSVPILCFACLQDWQTACASCRACDVLLC